MNARSVFAGIVLSIASLASVYAQDFRATLTGQVTDPSGAVIADATVTATNVQTNAVVQTKSTADGHYTIPYLNPGTYAVEIKAEGFQAVKRENIELRVAAKVDLPVRLAIGRMNQEVTVNGEQEALETADASRGLVFDPLQTQQLPLNGRQEYMLMALTPGVLFTQEAFGPGGYSGTRGWDVSNAYKINGARTGTNVFLLNGARVSDNSGAWQVAPNIESVQEFKVMTNTYDAQFGGFSGGAVNTTLKSGTNEFHGDVFDYFRNSYMDANNFANNVNGQATPYHNQHQFGGVFGGPVRKNKDFFFLSFEGWREVLPAPATDTIPTLNMRQGLFGADGIHVYDPLTSVPCNASSGCSGHVYVRSEFPGDIIPQNRLSPVGMKMLSFFPNPTNSALQYNFNNPNTKDQYAYNQPIVRFDHVFNDSNRLYGMFTWQHGSENDDWTGFNNPASQGNINNERTDQNYILDFTHVVSPTAIFDVRASYGRFSNNQPGWGDPGYQASSLGMYGNCAPTISGCAAPSVALSNNYTRLFGNQWMPLVNWWSFNTWDLNPSLTMTHGAHTLHIGGEVLYQARPSQNAGWASGLLSFNQGWTQHYSDQGLGFNDGSPIASLMLGDAASGQVDYNASQYITRPLNAGYVQDDWKVSPRLTVNAGVRYEVQLPWMERYNRAIRGFDFNSVNPYSSAVVSNWNTLAQQYNSANPNAAVPYPSAPQALYGGMLFAGADGQSRRVYNTDWTNFAPRLGIAYRITDKTVFRAGGGVFYRQAQDGLSSQYGYSQTTGYNAVAPDGMTPSSGADLAGPYSLANPFPVGIAAPAGNSAGLMTNAGGPISFYNPDYRIPRTYQYSAGFQRELPKGNVLEVSYSGNREIFVPVAFNMDNAPANQDQLNQAIATPSLFSKTFANPFYGVLPKTQSIAANPTISYSQLVRNWPLFTNLTQQYVQVGHYRSDQLQVKLERRVSGNAKAGVFTYVLSYTYGKQMQADHRKDNYLTDEPLLYEIDDGTKLHQLAFSGVYDLPIGNGKAWSPKSAALNRLVGDWRLDYIFSYASGFPVAWPGLLNYCGTWQTANQNENSWFNNNKSCYSSLPAYVINPNQDRFSTIFNPAKPQLNAAVEKSVAINERFRFVLRGEAFNVTNTAIRPGPDTNFGDSTFGQLPKKQQNFPRTLQLAAKFYF